MIFCACYQNRMYKTRTKKTGKIHTYVYNKYKIRIKTRTKHVQNTHAEHVQNTYKTRTKYVQNTYKTQTGIRIKDVQKTFRIQWELFQEIILMICTHVHPKNIPNVMTLLVHFSCKNTKNSSFNIRHLLKSFCGCSYSVFFLCFQ